MFRPRRNGQVVTYAESSDDEERSDDEESSDDEEKGENEAAGPASLGTPRAGPVRRSLVSEPNESRPTPFSPLSPASARCNALALDTKAALESVSARGKRKLFAMHGNILSSSSATGAAAVAAPSVAEFNQLACRCQQNIAYPPVDLQRTMLFFAGTDGQTSTTIGLPFITVAGQLKDLPGWQPGLSPDIRTVTKKRRTASTGKLKTVTVREIWLPMANNRGPKWTHFHNNVRLFLSCLALENSHILTFFTAQIIVCASSCEQNLMDLQVAFDLSRENVVKLLLSDTVKYDNVLGVSKPAGPAEAQQAAAAFGTNVLNCIQDVEANPMLDRMVIVCLGTGWL